jgi:hypothetical protein
LRDKPKIRKPDPIQLDRISRSPRRQRAAAASRSIPERNPAKWKPADRKIAR